MNHPYSRDDAQKIARRVIRRPVRTEYNNLNEGNQCQLWVDGNRIASGSNWREAVISLLDIVKEYYL